MTLMGEKRQSRARRFLRRLRVYALVSALIGTLSTVPSSLILLSPRKKAELALVWQGIGGILKQAPLDLVGYFLDVLSPIVITSFLTALVSLALMSAIDLSQERRRYEKQVRDGTDLVTPEQFMRLFDTEGLSVTYTVEERLYHRAGVAAVIMLLLSLIHI